MTRILAMAAGINPESVKKRYHGMDYSPCHCGCSIFNVSKSGEIACASCGSGDCNEMHESDPEIQKEYPWRFVLIDYQGRQRLCEISKCLEMVANERAATAKDPDQVAMAANRARQLAAIEARRR